MASLPEVYLARHGETAWTLTGQHTGRTDIPLTARGERQAQSLAQRLTGVVFARVLTSPLSRALRTCALAGFGGQAEIDADLQGVCFFRNDAELEKNQRIMAHCT